MNTAKAFTELLQTLPSVQAELVIQILEADPPLLLVRLHEGTLYPVLYQQDAQLIRQGQTVFALLTSPRLHFAPISGPDLEGYVQDLPRALKIRPKGQQTEIIDGKVKHLLNLPEDQARLLLSPYHFAAPAPFHRAQIYARRLISSVPKGLEA